MNKSDSTILHGLLGEHFSSSTITMVFTLTDIVKCLEIMLYTKLYKCKAESVSCKRLIHCNPNDTESLRHFDVLNIVYINLYNIFL